MELRCKACDSRLTYYDYALKQDDNSDEDLCSRCRDIVYLAEAEELDTREYAHQHLTEIWVNFVNSMSFTNSNENT